jgi:3-deoxy-D-manno-octulosonic-acid transferase
LAPPAPLRYGNDRACRPPPDAENFRDIVEAFRKADALRVVTMQSLIPTVLQLLENHEECAALGKRAAEVVRSQQGATQATVHALLSVLQVLVNSVSSQVRS